MIRYLLPLLLPTLLPAAGSQDCAACHAEIYRRYMATPMARTSGRAGSGGFQEKYDHVDFTSPGGSVEYHAKPRSFTFRSGEVQGSRSIDYYIGSGLVGRSYITAMDGFLFQAPIAYYTAAKQWKLSPGYEHSEELNLVREVDGACLNCHATGVQVLADPPFREPGIACERCHGTGDEHIRTAKASAIVNPAKLDPVRRDSVCAQCHLPGAVEIAKAGKQATQYHPGERLSDYVSVFILKDANREATVNGHYERLSRSACFRAAKGKLWCGTCHRVHATAAVDYNAQCLTCHTTQSCKAGQSTNCTGCHMPRLPARTVQHAAFTDHSIPRRPQPLPELPRDVALAPFEGFDGADRELGLAYASVALKDNNRAWGMRAFELLSKAPSDLKVDAQLAQLYDRMGRDQQACRLYAQVYSTAGADSWAAAVNHGICLANEGKSEESIRIWQAALHQRPALESARVNLAVALFRTGHTAEATSLLKDGLRFNPASTRIAQLLRDMRPPQ